MRLRLRIAGWQQRGGGKAPRKIEQDGRNLRQHAAINDERRHLAFRVEREESGLRISFRANESGFASNGAPTSCRPMCAAMELEPGAKYSVSIRRLR